MGANPPYKRREGERMSARTSIATVLQKRRAEIESAWQQQLRHHNIAIESEVNWAPGVRSLYFRDPLGHLVELATPGLWGDE